MPYLIGPTSGLGSLDIRIRLLSTTVKYPAQSRCEANRSTIALAERVGLSARARNNISSWNADYMLECEISEILVECENCASGFDCQRDNTFVSNPWTQVTYPC